MPWDALPKILQKEDPMKKETGKKFIALFALFFIILGSLLMFFSISGNIRKKEAMETYETTDGYLIDHERYSHHKKNRTKTYRLTYSYTVDGVAYEVSTDYGT